MVIPFIRTTISSIVFLSVLTVFALMPISGAAESESTPQPTPDWENVPPFSLDLENSIRQSPEVKAAIRANEAGQVELILDGRSKPPLLGGIKPWTPQERLRVMVWKEAGFDLVWLPYEFAYGSSRNGYASVSRFNRPFWDGANQYVREDVEKLLWRVLRAYPNAKIILWPLLDAYPGWDDEHPEELYRSEHGDGLVATTHAVRIGSKNSDAQQHERYAWSMFSPVFRKEAGEALRELIKTVNTSVPGKRVAGYMLGGGQDWQLYAWDPPDNMVEKDPAFQGDYSKPAVKAWQAWLEAKYQTPQGLSKAWSRAIPDFQSVKPPQSSALVGAQSCFDPQTEQQSIDWRRFLAEGRADLVSYFAGMARKAAGPDKLVGICAGDSGSRYGMTATGLLLRDKNVNLVFGQPAYGADRRFPPAVGGIGAILSSHALHGKIFIADMDQQTWMVKNRTEQHGTISISSDSRGYAQNISQLQAMWRREVGLLWQNGAGPMFHPIYGENTYEDPKIKEELKFLRETLPSLTVASPTTPCSDVAVIYDERSVAYLKQGLSACHWQWTNGQEAELNGSGVPYRHYFADDFRDGLVPPAKVYVFCNVFNFDKKFIAQVEKLKQGGRVLVWLQGTGFAKRNTDIALISKTTGIKLARFDREIPLQLQAGLQASNDLGLNREALSKQSLDSDAQMGLQAVDPQAVSLATYPASQKAGIVIKNMDSWSSIFVGSFVLSRNTINSITEYAHAWKIAPPGNVVAAGPNWISIQPLREGTVTLQTNRPVALKAIWPEEMSSPKGFNHPFKLQAGNTYWFKME
ncbi:MAG: beta-galactosidase [Chthoniobacteraceae bacterium]